MSDHPRRPATLQSMGVVAGNGHASADDDSGPFTEAVPRSEMQTPPHGVSRDSFLAMPQEDKNSLIYEEMGATRREITRQGAAHSALARGFETLGGKVDAAITDARSDRIAHSNDRREWRAAVQDLSKNQLAFDTQLARMPSAITERVTRDVQAAIGKQIDNLVARFEAKLDGVKQSDAETKQSLVRAHGRIGLHDDRLDKIEMHENVQDARLRGVEFDIGEVPHKLDPRESLRDLTPEQVKEREENAAKGTGLRGDIARVDNNTVAMNRRFLINVGIISAAPTLLVKVGEAAGPGWAAAVGVAGAALYALGAVGIRARERLRAWWAARRIKAALVSEKKKDGGSK